jgi:SAM-dependent methyltransferase
MLARLRAIYDRNRSALARLFGVVARLPVQFEAWVAEQMFLMSARNPVLGRASLPGMLFALPAFAFKALGSIWREARGDQVLRLYQVRNAAHYAPGGRGYSGLGELSTEDAARRFASLPSRLEPLVAAYPTLIQYRNGDSFLDAGCGQGQNLGYIARAFPDSRYTGFDIDERCLKIAASGLGGVAHRTLVHGSLGDAAFLRAMPDRSVDHVLICHVFSVLLESSVAATREYHARIIDEFVRIAAKSVLVIDQMSLGHEPEVIIEHVTRASMRENILAYFAKHAPLGEACILPGENTQAVLFKRTKTGA